jgi:hypothetical protein
MHFNLSTFDRELWHNKNTKPSTQHTFMMLGHSSLTKITNEHLIQNQQQTYTPKLEKIETTTLLKNHNT